MFMGSIVGSEVTAAAIGLKAGVRRDPFAMLPFCGYHMGDYWQHWFDMGDKLGDKAPKIFYVNWFRKTEDGKWLWPGYGENSRVLKWMCERVEGVAGGVETPIGIMPGISDLDCSGLDVSEEDMTELLHVDEKAWQSELPEVDEFFGKFGDKLPARIKAQLEKLRERLG